MGQCTNGAIQIELQSKEDANYVYDQIENITKLTHERMGYDREPAFNLTDNHVEGDIFNCNVYADRVPNGEFQIEQVIAQVSVMVKEGKIQPPYSFNADLLVQHQGWSLDEDDFEEYETGN